MRLSDSIVTALSALRHPEKRHTIALARQFKGKTGIEIGGPSGFFRQRSYFPVYLYASRIDGVNFNAHTVWEGKIEEGYTYKYLDGYALGKQFITEAAELINIPDESYDFLLSCHSLEHVANPIKALKRWHEVLKDNGQLCLILPNKEATFDVNRPYTTFDHLLDDYNRVVDEHDSTHFEEIFQLHSIELDPGITTYEELTERTHNNFGNRCIHHHVFSQDVIKKMLQYCGFDVTEQKVIHGINLFNLAIKR